jgi:hypothetical protein
MIKMKGHGKKFIAIFLIMLMCTSAVVSANVIKNENKNENDCINPGAPQKTVIGGKLTPPWGWWGHYHERPIDDGGNLWFDDGDEDGDAYEVDIYAQQSNGAGHIWPIPSTLEVTQRASNVEQWTIPETGPYNFKFDLECSGYYDLFSQYEEVEIFIYWSLASTETFVYFKVQDVDKNDLWTYEKKVCNDLAVDGQVFSDDYSAHVSKRSDTLYLNEGEQIWVRGGIKVVTYTTGTIPGIVEGNHNSKLNYVEIDWPNDPPNKPTISGPSKGNYESDPFSFKFVSTDPNNDDIYYYIEWGDGNNIGWRGPYWSGVEKTFSHSYPNPDNPSSDLPKNYQIRAKAKDEYGAESGWATYTFTLPKNRVTINSCLNFLEQYPIIFQLLKRILNL